MPFVPTNYEGKDRLSHIEDYLVVGTKNDSLNRRQLSWNARGIMTESFDLGTSNAGFVLGPSLAYCSLVGLKAGDIVTNVVALCTSAQAPGICQAGVFQSDGTHLGHTASLGASIVGSQFWQAPLTSPITILSDGGYYLAIMAQGSATMPTFTRGSATTTPALGSNPRLMAVSGAVPDLTGNLTLAGTGQLVWLAVN